MVKVCVDFPNVLAFEDGKTDFTGRLFGDNFNYFAEIHFAGKRELTRENCLVEVFEAKVEFEKIGASNEICFFEIVGDFSDRFTFFDFKTKRFNA